MTIIDKLWNKINQLEEHSQERKMYEDICAQLLAVCDKVAKETNNGFSDIITNIEFKMDFLWDECRSLIFYTTLNNHEKKYLLKFDLYHTHYEFQYLYF